MSANNKIIDINCSVNARKCPWKCDTFNTMPKKKNTRKQTNCAIPMNEHRDMDCDTIFK